MSRQEPKNIAGAKIRRLRLAAKPAISQEDMVGRLAVLGVQMDRSALSRIENQERQLYDYEIAAFARALKIPVETLFEKPPTPQPKGLEVNEDGSPWGSKRTD